MLLMPNFENINVPGYDGISIDPAGKIESNISLKSPWAWGGNFPNLMESMKRNLRKALHQHQKFSKPENWIFISEEYFPPGSRLRILGKLWSIFGVTKDHARSAELVVDAGDCVQYEGRIPSKIFFHKSVRVEKREELHLYMVREGGHFINVTRLQDEMRSSGVSKVILMACNEAVEIGPEFFASRLLKLH